MASLLFVENTYGFAHAIRSLFVLYVNPLAIFFLQEMKESLEKVYNDFVAMKDRCARCICQNLPRHELWALVFWVVVGIHCWVRATR